MTGGAGGKWMLFKEAKEAQLGGGDKPDYLNVLATVIHIRSSNCTYKACPTENCNKKVVLCVFSGKYYVFLDATIFTYDTMYRRSKYKFGESVFRV